MRCRLSTFFSHQPWVAGFIPRWCLTAHFLEKKKKFRGIDGHGVPAFGVSTLFRLPAHPTDY
jgi:hypothetical protein